MRMGSIKREVKVCSRGAFVYGNEQQSDLVPEG